MVDVPTVLNVDDLDVGAGAAGDGPGRPGVDAAGGRVQVSLLRLKQRRGAERRGWHRQGFRIGDLDKVKGIQRVNQGFNILSWRQDKTIPEIEVGEVFARFGFETRLVSGERRLRAREEPLDADARTAGQEAGEAGELLARLSDKLAGAKPYGRALSELEVDSLFGKAGASSSVRRLRSRCVRVPCHRVQSRKRICTPHSGCGGVSRHIQVHRCNGSGEEQQYR